MLKEVFKGVRAASRTLGVIGDSKINEVLLSLAKDTVSKTDLILEANRRDLDLMSSEDPMYDRLLLSRSRIEGIAADIRNVASLPSPVGRVLRENIRPNGMKITKVSVPFGVIGVIYEARPNVGFDVFSLCFKSGNACILKGGSDAKYSNEVIISIIRDVLAKHGIDPNAAVLLPVDRSATAELLNAVEYVDLVIPRGSKGLIEYVRDNARIPVIETGAGVCHTYFHSAGDREIGAAVINNAKTRRVSVCNALDCLIIDRSRLSDLPYLCAKLAESNVLIYADDDAYVALQGEYPSMLLQHSDRESFGTEFQSYTMAIKSVGGVDEAISHIDRYSSKHSEAIITSDAAAAEHFRGMVDAACVYVNVSTAFTDGAQFGLGAEIGISTQKMHARGPMGLEELTSYKYIIEGDGQVRP